MRAWLWGWEARSKLECSPRGPPVITFEPGKPPICIAGGRHIRRRSSQQATLSRSSSFPNPAFLFRPETTPPSKEGPAVRIHSPPPVSLSQRGRADAVRQSRGLGAGLSLVRDVRKGQAGDELTQCGTLSLSGIDAVPVRQSSGRSQRRAGGGGAVACGISPDFAAQLASSLRCSVQSRGRSSSVRRVAVNSTGCRPCKIASTSSGLKKARPTSRRM